MTDLIREAAERATDRLKQSATGSAVQWPAMQAIIEAALRKKFTGAGLGEVLPCQADLGNAHCDSIPDGLPHGQHGNWCPAFYRPAVAALIEARVAAALERAARAVERLYPETPHFICVDLKSVRADAALVVRALASSEPGSEVSK